MKNLYLIALLTLVTTFGINAQADLTVTDPDCLGSVDFDSTGLDGTGRTLFAEIPNNGSLVGVALSYNQTLGEWVIHDVNDIDVVVYTTGPNTFSPNPPDSGTQPWTAGAASFCNFQGSDLSATVTGTATQTMAGGDPCAMLGGDSDFDGVCDDNDACPGSDDNEDMDMDGFPDGCDMNPTMADGVLITSPCLGTDPVLLPLSGNDGLRNTYENTTFSIELSFNATTMQWEVTEVGGVMQVLFTNSETSVPNPPNTSLGTWTPGGFCSMDAMPTFEGTGTQGMRCLNTCPSGDGCTEFMLDDDCMCVAMPDATPPTLVCSDTTLYLDIDGMASVTLEELLVSATDNCMVMDTTFSTEEAQEYTCDDVVTGSFIITDAITITDDSDNPSSCSVEITVLDTIPFSVDCADPFFADMTIACLDSLAEPDLMMAESLVMDNCSTDDVILNFNDPNNEGSGCPEDTLIIERIYEYERLPMEGQQTPGGAPSIVTCTQVITIISTEEPTITCPPDSLINCGVFPFADTAAVTTTQECGMNADVMVSGPVIDGMVDSAGTTYTFTYSFTDACGRMASCDQVFTVQDTIAPVIISCVTDTTIYLDENGTAAIAPGELLVTEDDCAPATTMVGDPLTLFDCEDAGMTFPFVEQDTDVAGNVSEPCQINVTVLDTISPVIACDDITVLLDENGMAVVEDTLAAVISLSDNCTDSAAMALTLTVEMLDCDSEGVTGMIEVMDASMNITTCSFDVFVEDTIAPVITCPETIMAFVGDSSCSVAVDYELEATDNCGPPIFFDYTIPTGSTFQLGSTEVTAFAFDNGENTSEACVFNVMVQDTIAPSLTCQDIAVFLDENSVATVMDTADAILALSDNCTGPDDLVIALTAPEFDCTSEPAMATLMATDSSGNVSMCEIMVTPLDTVSPTIMAMDTTLFLDENGMASLSSMDFEDDASDNCSVSVTSVLRPEMESADFSCSDLGSPNPVVITVEDASGNMAMQQIAVTVQDTTPPTIICMAPPAPVVANDDCLFQGSPGDFEVADNCGSSLTIQAIFTDEADQPITTLDTFRANGTHAIGGFRSLPIGDNNVQVFVTDPSGLMDSCSFTVTVADSTAPAIACQDIEVFLDDAGMAVVSDTLAALVSLSDNCSDSMDVTLVLEAPEFACTDEAMMATYFATDAAGNIDSCSFSITPVDSIAPTLVVADTTLFLDEQGMAQLVLEDFSDDLMDNCDAEISDIFRVMENGQNFQGTAAGGVLGEAQGIATTAQFVLDQVLFFSCDDVGNVNLEVEVIGTDLAGNEVRDTLLVTVLDTLTPIITCTPVDAGSLFVGDDCTFEASPGTLQVTDNCGDPITVQEVVTGPDGTILRDSTYLAASDSFDLTEGTVFPIGESTVTTFVTDRNGLVDSCSFTITLADSTRPNIVCEDITVFLDSMGQVTDDLFDLAVVSLSDNCTDSADITVALEVPTLDCAAGDIMASITVTDANTNSNACTFAVAVMDTIAPTAVCQNIILPLDDMGMASIDQLEGSALDGGSTDNCASEGLTFIESATEFNCDSLGERDVMLIVTDASGLSDTCVAMVTVVDTTRPVVVTTDQMLTLTDLDPTMSITLDDIIAVMDNCDADPDAMADRDLTFGGADIGANVVTVTVTDSSGNVTVVTVNVTVDFVQPLLSCLTNVNVTLDDDCSFTVIPRQVLTGNVALLDFFPFDIVVMDSDTSNGPVIDGCGSFSYKIVSTGTGVLDLDFDQCWGTIHAEDKTPPVLVDRPLNVNNLLCADVEANNINSLGPDVSKCFLVDGLGAIIEGSMDEGLLAILSPDAFDDMSPDTALIPTFTDGCASSIQVCVSDIVERPEDGCGATVITRFFRAQQAEGCTPIAEEEDEMEDILTSFTLTFVRPTIDSLDGSGIMPVVTIEACGSPTSPLEFVPNPEDYPVLTFGDRTLSLVGENAAMCSMVAVTYENSQNPIQPCPNTVKFTRTYTVVDWCSPTDVRTFTQFVEVGDGTGPDFSGPAMTVNSAGVQDTEITYRTNVGGECAAVVRLDGAGVSATDLCSGSNIDIVVSIYPDGDLTQAPFGAYPVDLGNGVAELSDPLALGNYSFVYTATDECGNQTVTTVPFVVVDGAAPFMVCEDGLNISLDSNGEAVLTAEEVDKGSEDDCDIELTLDLNFGPTMDMPANFFDEVTFTCADLGTQFVTLRGTDAAGNDNTCWLEVLVELKDAAVPTCIAPSPATMTCEEISLMIPTALVEATTEELNAAFGTPTIVSTCDATVTSTLTNSLLNECGIGTIVRSFTAENSAGINSGTCAQLITIVGVYDYQIVLPGDAVSNECMGEFEADELEIIGGSCDLPVVTPVTEEVFGTPGAECYQIQTTYTIINTCEYDPAFGATTLITRNGLSVADSEPIYVNVQSNLGLDGSDDFAFISGSANEEFTPGADDDLAITGYATSLGRGSFTYVQTIDVFDRTAPEVNIAAPTECISGCTVDISLPFTATDDCLMPTLQAELDANFDGTNFEAVQIDGIVVTIDASDAANGNYVLNVTNVPGGDHAVRLRATDGCGNTHPVIVPFSVCGDVAPTPLCIQTLVATLQMNDENTMPMAEVWASDFLTDSPLIDCFGNEVTDFAIIRAEETMVTRADTGLKVFCSDVEDFVTARVYAFDDAGNEPAFCEVLIQVDPGQGVSCETGGNIAGQIMTQHEAPVARVMVSLSGADDEVLMAMTDEFGDFDFGEVELGIDYTVQPAHEVPVNLQEVKVSDVVAISRMILGETSFENAYDYIAGDVDQSGHINVLDMVLIQRVILGLDEMFPTGDSWRFVGGSHPVSETNWMQAFPEVFNVNDLSGNLLDVAFVGIEMGNVRDSEGRSTLNLETEDASLQSGSEHTIKLSSEELYGFQGTLDLGTDLVVRAVDFNGEGALNLNFIDQGFIGMAMRSQAEILLHVRAVNDVLLSEAVELTDDLVYQEGVNQQGGSTGLGLSFIQTIAPAAAQNALLQNVPNPVVEATQIEFTLAKAGEATLTLRDAAGRLVAKRVLNAVAGQNLVTFQHADLGASGILTYTLESGDFSATRKMVVIR